jgi:hypothetical protein
MNQFASGVIRSRGVCTTLRRPVCCHGLPIGRHWPPSAAHVLAATLFNTPVHERFASPSPQLSPYPRQLHVQRAQHDRRQLTRLQVADN